MDAVAPALAVLLLCAMAMLVVRLHRGRRRPADRAHLVEEALSRAREKQRTLTDGARGDDDPNGTHAA